MRLKLEAETPRKNRQRRAVSCCGVSTAWRPKVLSRPHPLQPETLGTLNSQATSLSADSIYEVNEFHREAEASSCPPRTLVLPASISRTEAVPSAGLDLCPGEQKGHTCEKKMEGADGAAQLVAFLPSVHGVQSLVLCELDMAVRTSNPSTLKTEAGRSTLRSSLTIQQVRG